jgi:hypothetical protein
MAVSSDFADFVKDQLAPVRTLTSGRFFGGIGLAAGGVQFATKKGRVDVNKYYEVPAE